MGVKFKESIEFIELTRDILNNNDYKKLKYISHHDDSIFKHNVEVAYLSYKITKKLKWDYQSTVRGAMLHDFFFYDWKVPTEKPLPLLKKHGFVHAKISLDNARKNFELNKIESDIIVKHMFPLNIALPRYKESWIVTMIDKYNATKEFLKKWLQ